MIRLFAILLLLAGPGLGETVRVYSGEHADFTRLVLELPVAAEWTVGRTPVGYAFAFGAADQPAYDTSQVWDRIPKTRLQALRVDHATGILHLTLACACHVFPFEYQPGVVVLDIKPGPAPEGSVFETAFAPLAKGSIGPPVATPVAPVYDWLEQGRETANALPPATDIPLPTGGVSLDPLRDELLKEISRGAAQGVVDMALPDQPPDPGNQETGATPWAQIIVGPPPDSLVVTPDEGTESLTSTGEVCTPDALLALDEWGKGRPPAELLVEARAGLYGEFDALDPDEVLRAVRLHLYLGFGAEAAQYAQLLGDTHPADDLAILRSMALLVDGEQDPDAPFLNMLACDGQAALWAALAQTPLPPAAKINADAIARSFMALPPHLRASLGAALAENLLYRGEEEAARIVRNAIEHTPDITPATVARLDAKTELHDGRAEEALEHATVAVAEDGNEVEDWAVVVEAHFRTLDPMTSEAAETLISFEGEIEIPARKQDFYRTLALAEMLSGQTEAGFHTAQTHDVPLSDPWQVAVALAVDDDFLRHAVPEGMDAPLPGIAPEVAMAVARRLAGLGFPDATLAWLQPTLPEDSPDKRRLAAAALLARGEASRALDLLLGLSTPEDEALRARTLVQLGQIADARLAYEAAGQTEDSLRLAAWDGAWPDLHATETPLWANAVKDSAPIQPDSKGTLARGAAILDASAASRDSILALLDGVKTIDP